MTDVTLGTASTPNMNNVNWHNNAFTTGNTLSLEVANISYTDGEGDETVVFNGFTELRLATYSSAPAGNISYYVGLTDVTTITGDPTFEADLTSNGTSDTLYFTAADGPVRLRQADFQFEIIPEPGTYALLAGLTGLAFVMVRRRRA